MKKLEQVKLSVANENSFKDWEELESKFDGKTLGYAWQDVCKDYATEAVKADRERIKERLTKAAAYSASHIISTIPYELP